MDSGAVGVLGIASGSVCLERKGERSASRAESLRLQPMLLPVLGKPTTPFPWKFLSVSASAKSSLRAGVGSHALHQLLAGPLVISILKRDLERLANLHNT